MVCGWAVGAQAARNGNDDSGVQMPCARRENHLGQAGGSAAAYPVGVGGYHVRQRVVGLVGGACGECRPGLFVDGDRRGDHFEHPGPLPIGQVPAHRNRDGADLPAAQRGQHQLLGVGNRQCDKRTELCAGGRQRPTPLIGPAVQFREGHRVRGTVARDDGQSRVVTTLFGELLKFGAERNSVVWRIGGAPRHDGRLRCSRRYRCRRTTSRARRRGTAGSRRIASTSVLTGSRISGWVCRSSTLTSDSSQKPSAPSNWCAVRSTCRAVSAALSRSISASAERTCAGADSDSADGVLGEFVKPARRDRGVGDRESDRLEIPPAACRTAFARRRAVE